MRQEWTKDGSASTGSVCSVNRLLTETDEKNQKVLWLYNLVPTNIESGWQRTLPSSQKGKVHHQRPVFILKDTEDSSITNTDETSEIDKGELGEHIPASLV